MAEDEEEKRRRRRGDAVDVGTDGAESGVEAVADGCFGCDINLLIALTLLAGLPVLLWSL